MEVFSYTKKSSRGLTLIEVLVIVAVLGLFGVFLLPWMERSEVVADRLQCNNNLKQIGLAFRVWEGDNHDKYPMAISQTNGGTMEFVTGPNAWRTFQVVSNELSTPWVLSCPSDKRPEHLLATTFDIPDAKHKVQFLNNSNLSFFLGIDANEANPQLMLAGDCNITNGTQVQNGILGLTTNRPGGWNSELHNGAGNVALSDGSVQSLATAHLKITVANTGMETNRLLMPVLVP